MSQPTRVTKGHVKNSWCIDVSREEARSTGPGLSRRVLDVYTCVASGVGGGLLIL